VASVWAFVVLGGAFVFESLSLTVASRAFQRSRGDTPLREYWRRNRDPTLLLLIGVALVLALESYSLLLDESAPRDVLDRIVRVASADAAVSRVVGLRTMHLGPTSLLEVLEIDFRDELSAAELEAASARLRRTVAAAVGETGEPRLVVIDPRTAPSSARTAAA
jgi:hypothetical protein